MISRRSFVLQCASAIAAITGCAAEAREIARASEHVFGGADQDSTRRYLRTFPVGLDRLWVIRPGGEEIISVFRKPEPVFQPLPDQLRLLSFFWRDVADEGKQIDIHPYLPMILAGVQTTAAYLAARPMPLILTSGFRTPERNAHIEGAAKNSLHTKGFAGDVKLEGFTPEQLAGIARHAGAGGVGIYSSFTHIDIGAVRDWRGTRPEASSND